MPNAIKRIVEPFWYVLKSERDKPLEQQSRFLCAPLAQADRMRVWDETAVTSSVMDGSDQKSAIVMSRSFRQAYELAMSNIVEIERFPLDGPKAWPKDGTADQKRQYLEALDDFDVYEIGVAIRERSVLEDEVKNS